MTAQTATALSNLDYETTQSLSRRLTLALRASNIGVWEYNIVDGTLVWDDQMYRLYGITAKTFSGAYEAWENGLHPDDLDQGQKDLQDAIADVRKFDTEFRVIWPNGEIRNIRAIADVFHDEAGHPSHMYGVNSDVTEERQLQTDALVQQNKDLQHFSHIAAHDLREPCRRQKALSQIALEDYADSMSPELKRMLVQIGQQSSQMLEMINSFRALTNIGSKVLSHSQIHMQEAVHTILDEFRDELQTATIECKLHITITGYLDLIHILLRNIIGNAVKYGDTDMKLSIFHENVDGKCVFVFENTGGDG